MPSRRAFLASTAAGIAAAAASPWRIVYRRDEGYTFTDLHASGEALLAVSNPKLLLTFDGGATWDHPLATDHAVTGFVLDRDNLWLVGSSGLWKSTDQAKTWKRQIEQPGLERTYFLSPERGFACGSGRTLLETFDGGAQWARVPAADEPDTVAAHTTYHWIDFVTPRAGIVTGASRPPRRGASGSLPAWRDPMKHLRRREWPSASLTLETRDAGLTWKHSSTSLFGRISRVRYSRDGHGLAVVEFHDAFEWPSEVFVIRLRTGQSERAFREKNRAVTDAVAFSGTSAYLAAIEPPADPSESTLGTLRVLHSGDFQTWTEMELPEAIPAGRAFFTGKTEDNFWLATDTGFVLRRG